MTSHRIYFQHQGHSVSIIGIERTANGQRHLLQYNTGSSVESLKDIRIANLDSHRAYQLLRIVKVGPYETEKEREDAKVLKSIRIE